MQDLLTAAGSSSDASPAPEVAASLRRRGSENQPMQEAIGNLRGGGTGGRGGRGGHKSGGLRKAALASISLPMLGGGSGTDGGGAGALPPPPIAVGDFLDGRYRVEGLYGVGGASEFWQARDTWASSSSDTTGSKEGAGSSGRGLGGQTMKDSEEPVIIKVWSKMRCLLCLASSLQFTYQPLMPFVTPTGLKARQLVALSGGLV